MHDTDTPATKPSFTTERLRLRPITMDDAPLLVELDSDPLVTKYTNHGKPTPPDQMINEILPRMLSFAEANPGHGFWAAHELDGDAFIGWFHLRPYKEPPHDLDLGYRLRRAAWGKGYATEGSRVLLAHAFETLGVTRVTAMAEPEHERSQNVMTKLGMRSEGIVPHWAGILVARYAIEK